MRHVRALRGVRGFPRVLPVVALCGATGLVWHASSASPLPAVTLPLPPPPPPAPVVVAPAPVTIASLARPDWFRWLVAVGMAAAEALLALLMPGAIGGVLGASATSSDYAYLGAVLLSRAAASALAGTFVRTACEKLGERMRAAIYGACLARDVADYDDGSALERWTLLNNDVREYKAAVGKLVADGVPAVVTVAGGSYLLWLQSPTLTVLLGVTAPLVLGSGAWLAQQLRQRLHRVRELEATSISESGEVLQHLRTIRINATEPEELEHHCKRLAAISAEYAVLHKYLSMFHASAGVALVGITGLSLGVGSWWMGGTESLGGPAQLTAYLYGALRVQGAVSTLSLLTSESLRVLPACGERVLSGVNHVPRIPLTGGRQLGSVVGVGVEWHNVTFGYRPDQPVLRNVTLRVNPGEAVAFVGKSGAGKSTLLALLLRLYEPDAGAVLFGGVPLSSLDARQLRRRVLGVVEQRPTVRPGTVRDNILYGTDAGQVSEEQLHEAARMAFAHDFIMELPLGYDTPVTESTLSGGQMQRLAIARALVKDPAVLVFDESTASLDSVSEAAIRLCIQRSAAAGKAVIVIAHKLSTVMACSRVVVLQQGAVAQSGTHAQLVAEPGLYRDLFGSESAHD